MVGAGQAAVQLCLALRKEKFDGPVTVFSEENQYPYHRPPLSKSYLLGKDDSSKLPMRPESFYAAKNVAMRLNEKITRVDPASRTVFSEAGEYHYDHLLLATGARPRPLPINGSDLSGVCELRDVDHANAIAQGLRTAKSVVIIGAGFIGLEVASAARAMGKEVTVLDMADRVMARAVAPQVSTWFEQTHRAAGIDIRLGQRVTAIHGVDGAVAEVELPDGSRMEAQLVIIGVGVIPNTGLAEQAGLACDNGIVVNEFCRTSDEAIFAAGDCANHPNPFAGGRAVRLESIQNATDQARVVAAGVAGNSKPYNSVPWFWSDQGAHSLQMTGLSFDADNHVIRGNMDSGVFSVFHFKSEKLLAVDSINMPRDHMLARKLLTAGISPAQEQVEDPGFELKSLI